MTTTSSPPDEPTARLGLSLAGLSPPGLSLAGRRGVVVGAASGIGHAIATTVTAMAADVLLVDNAEAVADVAAELGCVGLQADVTAPDAPGRVTAAVRERWDAPDFVVNCAGIQRRGSVLDLDEADWHDLFETNLHGIRRVSAELVRAVRAAGRPASIVNVSSSSVDSVTPGIVPYSMAKAALGQWTRGLAAELGPDRIRVNAVAPGYVQTAMTRDVLDDESFRSRVLARIPLGRLATPDDIAGTVVYLLSDLARYVTGVVVPVDGGYFLGSMRPPEHATDVHG